MESKGFAFPGGAENAVLRRTYAGRNQRSAGALSWFLDKKDDSVVPPFPYEVGGYEPAIDCLRGDVYRDHRGNIIFEAPSK
jgi:hypothetical protein